MASHWNKNYRGRVAVFLFYDSEDFLKFGKFGLVSFDVPGNASGMYIEWDESRDIFKRGAEFVSHNISYPLQQSALLKIWLMWAKFIEIKSRDKIK